MCCFYNPLELPCLASYPLGIDYRYVTKLSSLRGLRQRRREQRRKQPFRQHRTGSLFTTLTQKLGIASPALSVFLENLRCARGALALILGIASSALAFFGMFRVHGAVFFRRLELHLPIVFVLIHLLLKLKPIPRHLTPEKTFLQCTQRGRMSHSQLRNRTIHSKWEA